MVELGKLRSEIYVLLSRVYKNKAYPDKNDLVLGKDIVETLMYDIAKSNQINIELKECIDCYYCYQIAVSESKEILPELISSFHPLRPSALKPIRNDPEPEGDRKLWIPARISKNLRAL